MLFEIGSEIILEENRELKSNGTDVKFNDVTDIGDEKFRKSKNLS